MSLVALLALLIVIAAVLVIAAQHRGGWASDRDVLEQLRRDGSDLSRPHPVEFFFHFASRDIALKVAEILSSEGFATSVGPGAGSRYQILLASKVIVPLASDLAALRARFAILSAAEGGTYEGWASVVVRPGDGV